MTTKSIITESTRGVGRLRQIFYNPELLPTLTEDQAIDEVIAREKEVGLLVGEFWIVKHIDLPEKLGEDRFFEAWESNNGVISINMEKARAIHMDLIRSVRNQKLSELDSQYMRAIEANNNDAKKTIEKEKQILRDIPQTFDLSANTAEQLIQKWPSVLD